MSNTEKHVQMIIKWPKITIDDYYLTSAKAASTVEEHSLRNILFQETMVRYSAGFLFLEGVSLLNSHKCLIEISNENGQETLTQPTN